MNDVLVCLLTRFDAADTQQSDKNINAVVTTSTGEFDDDLDWGRLDCDAMETSARHSIEQPVPISVISS